MSTTGTMQRSLHETKAVHSSSAAEPTHALTILHVFDHSIPLQSGYTFRSRAILREQRARGWSTLHVTSPKQGATAAAEEEIDGLRFYRCAAPAIGMARSGPLNALAVMRSLYRRLVEVITRERPDIVHAHSPALNGVAALHAAARFGLPLVYEVRAFWEDAAVDHGTSREWGLRYRLTRALETHVLKRAAAVTTICEGLRQEMVGRGIPAERITVVPNAVDLAEFQPSAPPDAALQSQLGLSGRTVIGFVGSFYAYEGLDLLLEALPLMLKRRSDLALLLVGGGPEEQRLRERATALGLDGRVVFAGRVPHGEVSRYYDLIDVLAYPRLSMRLTDLVTPLKPLEAMAQRKLFLASDVGGHRELIDHGITGILFKAGSAEALAAAALELLERPETWPGLRERGRRHVELERNWPASVARYADVYARVLDRAR